MQFNLLSAKHSLDRLQKFQIDCGTLMKKVRGTVDDETYDILGRAYAISGNAALEMRTLIEEFEKLSYDS